MGVGSRCDSTWLTEHRVWVERDLQRGRVVVTDVGGRMAREDPKRGHFMHYA